MNEQKNLLTRIYVSKFIAIIAIFSGIFFGAIASNTTNTAEAVGERLGCILNISKNVDINTAQPGSVLTYRINFDNSGDADCTGGGVQVEDNVDSRLEYLSNTSSSNVDAGSYNGSKIYWNAATLNPGESGSVSWTARVREQNSGCASFDLPNQARITSAEYNNFQTWVYSNTTHTAINCPNPILPTVTISANPSSILYNGTSTIIWSSTNATSCSATGGSSGWSGGRALSGTFQTGALTNTSTYTITCRNSNNSTSDTTVVTVGFQVLNPTVTISADNTNLPYNSATYIRWSSQNATTCSANGGSSGWAGSRSTFGSFYTGVLTNTNTYNITCSNNTGSASDAVTVTVFQQQQNPTVTISANPISVAYGGTSIITWSSANATSCTAAGNGWSGSKGTSGSQSTGNLYSTAVYTIICTGTDGQVADSATVTVSNQIIQNPTVTISADNANVPYNGSTYIRWYSNNANTCYASGGSNGWVGSKSTSGNFYTGNLNYTATYSINCTNSYGSAYDSVTVNTAGNQIQNPTVSISADNTNINYNGSTTVRWYSNNANTCYASGGSNGWNGSRSTSGSFFVNNLTNTTIYNITCTNNSGSASDSVTVSTNQQIQNPTVSISADNTNVPYNGFTYVRWSSYNATACNAYGGSNSWIGSKSTSGSFYTGNLVSTAIYSISCSSNTGSAYDSATVTVGGQTIINPKPTPTAVLLVNSSVDRTEPIISTIDNSKPQPGDEINYTVNYQNIGTGGITNLILQINLPIEVDYLFSNPSNPTFSGNTLVFRLGTLRANSQGMTTIRVRVRDNIPAGTNLDFPAILSYIDPSGLSQSVSADVSAQVWGGTEKASLGANVLGIFGSGSFLPSSLFGWLLFLILLFILIILSRNLFSQSKEQKNPQNAGSLENK